jgi:hypothetical protein
MAAVVGAGRDGIPHLVAGREAISQDARLIERGSSEPGDFEGLETHYE